MQSILSVVETLVRDLRYAVRTLRRDAALTTFAILIIGVGVGASTIVFSVVNALWLRPLPFDDPGRLVWDVTVVERCRRLVRACLVGWMQERSSQLSLSNTRRFSKVQRQARFRRCM